MFKQVITYIARHKFEIIILLLILLAAANLIEKLDASLVEACFILNFSILPGKAKLEEKTPVYAVLEI